MAHFIEKQVEDYGLRKSIKMVNTRLWKYKSQPQQTGKLRGELFLYLCVYVWGVKTTDFRLRRGEKNQGNKRVGHPVAPPPCLLRAALVD